MTTLSNLAKRLGHTFQNIDLLEQALTHRSAGPLHNERLEFLGDAILGCLMASELYTRYPDLREGELSRLRSNLVNGETLTLIANDLALGKVLVLSAGERRAGGQARASILANAVEAVIGAIYVDAGLDAARVCVLQWYGDRFEDLSLLTVKKDAKSLLQEWTQANKMSLPQYESTVTGPAHAQHFHVVCRINGVDLTTEGESSNRRKAEQIAAQRFLDGLYEQ